MLMIVPLMLAILLPSLSRARELSKRVVCGANLRQVRLALDDYADANGGRFPPDWATLVTAENLQPKLFKCPSSGATVGDLSACFVLVDPADAPPDASTVVIYEKPQCHGNEGGNVCFNDGHCEFFHAEDLEELIAETKARSATPP